MQSSTKATILKLAGLILSIVPPAACALFYFPLWLGERASALSVMSIMVLSLCSIPFWRVIKQAFRSPSAWMLWLVIFLFTSLFESICAGLRVVALVGCLAGAVGALLFYFARRVGEKTNAG